MDFLQFLARAGFVPQLVFFGEGFPDYVETGLGVVADHQVAFEDSGDETFDFIGLCGSETFVYDEDVGDDQKVAIGREQVRFSGALLHGVCGFRRPCHAACELAGFVHGERVARDAGIFGIDEVDCVRVSFSIER